PGRSRNPPLRASKEPPRQRKAPPTATRPRPLEAITRRTRGTRRTEGYNLGSPVRESRVRLRLPLFGAVAQLGERMTGSHEVRGSIPLGSTRSSTPDA